MHFVVPNMLSVVPSGSLRMASMTIFVHYVQIDHGYTLPSTFADVCFEWLYWPQAKVPFDPATRAYIGALDAEADLATLEAHGLRLGAGCKRVFAASTLLLRKGAGRGLSPHAIGRVMCREEVGAFAMSWLQVQCHDFACLCRTTRWQVCG